MQISELAKSFDIVLLEASPAAEIEPNSRRIRIDSQSSDWPHRVGFIQQSSPASSSSTTLHLAPDKTVETFQIPIERNGPLPISVAGAAEILIGYSVRSIESIENSKKMSHLLMPDGLSYFLAQPETHFKQKTGHIKFVTNQVGKEYSLV